MKKDEEVPEEDQTLKLSNTSWVYNLDSELYGQPVIVNDTLNFVDDNKIDRHISFIAGPNESSNQAYFTYTWDGENLALIKEGTQDN